MKKPQYTESINFIPYANCWVAVVQNRVVGVGSSREQAYRAAKQVRPKDKSHLLFINSQGQPLQMTASEQAWVSRHNLLQQTVNILQARKIEAYLVGGAVRDFLLGRVNIVDLDFALPDNGLAVARQVANALNAAFYPLDSERGTGRVVCNDPTSPNQPKVYLDFATYRGSSLEDDLADRDFTINAIALSLNVEPQLVDPLNGRRDLEAGIIKMASGSAFQRDPVRVLRAVRQATDFGFSIETNTANAIRQAASLLPIISPERQRDELLKLLNTPKPGTAVRQLHHLNVLPHILPEAEAMAGVSQSSPHYLDVFEHTCTAMDMWVKMVQANWPNIPNPLRDKVAQYLDTTLAGNLSLKMLMPLALLLHDTGKPHTRTETIEDGQTKVRFLGHEKESAKISRQVVNRLRLSGQAADFVETVVAQHMRPHYLAATGKKISRRATYRFFRSTGGGIYEAGVAVALHALADQQATCPPNEGQAQEQALLNVAYHLINAFFEQYEQVVDPPPLLTGRDLIEMGVLQGKLIGLLLAQLKEAQASGEITTREEAIAFTRGIPDFAQTQDNNL